MNYHNPVLLDECLEALEIKPTGIYVDVTFGGGGHSNAIANKLSSGKLVAFDQDDDSIAQNDNENILLINQNFKYLKKYLRYYEMMPIDGLLADLGVSSYQIDTPERGFSTRYEGVLDMRMNRNNPLTAREIVNTYSEKDLQRIFSEYGELINSKKLALTIVEARKEREIVTINDLKDAIKSCVNKVNDNQYFAQVFQALRMEVNDELGALKDMLMQCSEVMKIGGRLAVISYHSLEDRLVKNFIAKGKFTGEVEKDFYGNKMEVPFKAVNKKPILAGHDERKRNPRSRSAKLRIAEKI
ncbi:MAG: 16S rRNA (cytosine(1402)-N(4))-methyltransferase RsmH [Bacteroidota bacterium]